MVQIDSTRPERENSSIGIITFHRTTNFGSALQMYGLYKKIELLGYSCEVIDYRCPAIEKRENLDQKAISLNPKRLFVELYVRPVQKQKAFQLERFTKEHVKMTDAYYPATVSNLRDTYSKLISGSDIIWGRDITENDYTYFLDFAGDKTKKYAFSCSVGNYEERGDEMVVGSLLQKYSTIAVREEAAVHWVYKVSGIEAKWVCDPTMLLTINEWVKEIRPSQINGDYVLVYFDDDRHKCLEDAQKYARSESLKVKYINYGKPRRGVNNIRPTKLEDFLGLIRNARCVFTSSYHGLLFSLYFHRELMYYTRAHSTRVESLAKLLGLSDHCGDSVDISKYKQINYDPIDERISRIRKESTDILMGMLEE